MGIIFVSPIDIDGNQLRHVSNRSDTDLAIFAPAIAGALN